MLRRMTTVALTAGLGIVAGCGSGPGKPVERIGGTYDVSGFVLKSLKGLVTERICKCRRCMATALKRCLSVFNSTSRRPLGWHRERGPALALKAQYDSVHNLPWRTVLGAEHWRTLRSDGAG